MLSLSEKALLTGSWWMIVIPGVFLVATLLSLTEIGNAIRRSLGHSQENFITAAFPKSAVFEKRRTLKYWYIFVGKPNILTPIDLLN